MHPNRADQLIAGVDRRKAGFCLTSVSHEFKAVLGASAENIWERLDVLKLATAKVSRAAHNPAGGRPRSPSDNANGICAFSLVRLRGALSRNRQDRRPSASKRMLQVAHPANIVDRL